MSTHADSSHIFQRRNNEEPWEYVEPDQIAQPLEPPESPFGPPSNIKEEYEDDDPVQRQHKILQGLYPPSTANEVHRAQKEYESAQIPHFRGSNIESWCVEFLAAYNQAKQLDLPEVQGLQAQKDFLRAINQMKSGYSAILAANIIKAEDACGRHRNQSIPPELQIQALAEDFLQYQYMTRSRKADIHVGTVGEERNSEEPPNSSKRGRNQNKPKKQCLCGDSHFWGQCPYIDTSQRSRGFVEDPEKAKRISDYESKDKKGLLNKIRERNRRHKKPKTGSPDQQAEPDSISVGAGDDTTDHTLRQPYVASSSAFNYRSTDLHNTLRHSWMLSSATNIHVCNNAAEFVWKAPATPDDVVFAGGAQVRIEAWGEVNIPLTTTDGIKTTVLKRVALIPSFFTSLVSLSRLTSSNVHFDSGKSILYRGGTPPEHVADLSEVGGHWLLVHRTEPPSSTREFVVIDS